MQRVDCTPRNTVADPMSPPSKWGLECLGPCPLPYYRRPPTASLFLGHNDHFPAGPARISHRPHQTETQVIKLHLPCRLACLSCPPKQQIVSLHPPPPRSERPTGRNNIFQISSSFIPNPRNEPRCLFVVPGVASTSDLGVRIPFRERPTSREPLHPTPIRSLTRH